MEPKNCWLVDVSPVPRGYRLGSSRLFSGVYLKDRRILVVHDAVLVVQKRVIHMLNGARIVNWIKIMTGQPTPPTKISNGVLTIGFPVLFLGGTLGGGWLISQN